MRNVVEARAWLGQHDARPIARPAGTDGVDHTPMVRTNRAPSAGERSGS